jgi:hypothetical protein
MKLEELNDLESDRDLVRSMQDAAIDYQMTSNSPGFDTGIGEEDRLAMPSPNDLDVGDALLLSTLFRKPRIRVGGADREVLADQITFPLNMPADDDGLLPNSLKRVKRSHQARVNV